MNVCLTPMTKELAREYFSKFVMDPALFMDGQEFRPYVYSEAHADATVKRYRDMGRIYLAVLLDGEPIGEIILKNLDHRAKCCTLGICLRSDEFKNRGYGTEAEILMLKYAFGELDMETIFADSLLKNTRSQHVLEKVGFHETHRDESFVYYRCDRTNWRSKNIPAEIVPVL